MKINKKLTAFFFTVAIALLTVGTAQAWHARGHVYCDVNQDGQIDDTDLRLENIGVTVDSLTGPFTGTGYTYEHSDPYRFSINLPDGPDSYRETLEEITLPGDATFVLPAVNEHLFELTDIVVDDYFDWLIDSAICRDGDVSGCRVTGGGNDTAGIDPTGGYDGTVAEAKLKESKAGGTNRYTFGGQAGANTGAQPQPKGEWTHHQQSGPDGSFVFHGGTASAPTGTEIDVIVCSDEGWCSPAREAPTKQIDFAGVGTFKNSKNPSVALANVVPGETFHGFEVHIEDLGEPGKGKKGESHPGSSDCPVGGSGTDAFADPPVFENANCSCPDFYRIRIFEGVIPVYDINTGEITNLNKTNVIYEVFGYINGGNLQIHPPTGFDLK